MRMEASRISTAGSVALVMQPVTPATAAALQYQWTQSFEATVRTDLKHRVLPDPLNDVEEAKPVPWQSVRDLPDRRLMVQRILTLTEKKRAARTGGTPPSSDAAASLAKRIELSLYSRAGSLDEYKNSATLRRRLQSLVSLSFHEAAAAKASPVAVRPGKRARPGSLAPSSKRRRLGAYTANSSLLLGPLSEDCLRTLFGFLDGREVLALRPLNRFAASFLPSCVTTLEVEVARFYRSFVDERAGPSLVQMTNLERLVVYKTTDPCAEPTSVEQRLALHAWGCTELDVTHDNAGELVVQHLASAMESGACRHLKQLQLVSVFTNTSHRNGLRHLCNALLRGSCPDLEDLLLGGNSITDIGTLDVARLLRSRALPHLMRLDLRRNYIGETGLQRVMTALAASPTTELQYLCMGGNLITDNSVSPLIGMLERGLYPQLRFLGLEDNFLSPEGVQSIIHAAVSGGMVPKLHRVANDGSSADLEE
ncbi:hypothetical protein Poli38472_001596 [Pythium oligandrum]|uniref:Uncharacterized protein n=1 Tax=Pythium oligandrum TaxID=41045 RepID=A0A8K1CVH4_PYTOL|nr:hypothetical protein Poli38472_001596 [Pythium oligandrum]|eukprot:TMW69440.1 hypothetical protein Poli38472_001596 [Pythium oligandrum]